MIAAAQVPFRLQAWRSDRWDDRLVRDAGTSAFVSPANLIVLLLLAGAVAWIVGERSPRRARAFAALAAALYVASLGQYLLAAGARGVAETGSVHAWEAAVALLIALGLCMTRSGEAQPARDHLGPALLVAAAPMLFALGQVPPRIHFEEMVIGLWCRAAAEGRMPELFWTGYSGIPILNFAVKGAFMLLGGGGLLGLRLSSAAVALGALAATGLLARELFPGSRAAAPLAVLFLGSNHLFLHYARDGIHIVDPTLAMSATALLVVRALRGRGSGWALVGGIVSGLAVQDYAPARAAPVWALLLILGGAAITGRLVVRRTALVLAALFLAGFVVALGALPLALATSPSTLGTRELDIVAFDGRDLLSGDGAAWARLAGNARETLRIHTLASDRDPHYGSGRAYVPPLLLPLLLLGLVALARDEGWLAAATLLPWIALVTTLGSLVMIEALNRRTIGLLPALALLFAGGCSFAMERASRRGLTAAAIALVAVPSFALDVHFALSDYPRLFPVDLATGTAIYARDHPGEPLQALVKPELDEGSYHLRFLAPGAPLTLVGRNARLGEGSVVASARYAARASALADEPGASLDRPFALPDAWERWASGATEPTPSDVVHCPPVVVRRTPRGR